MVYGLLYAKDSLIYSDIICKAYDFINVFSNPSYFKITLWGRLRVPRNRGKNIYLRGIKLGMPNYEEQSWRCLSLRFGLGID